MRKVIVIGTQDYSGHHTVDWTVAVITRDNWFYNLRRYVCNHIKMCLNRLVDREPHGKKPSLLHPVVSGKRPFRMVHIDHLSHLKRWPRKIGIFSLTKYSYFNPHKTFDAVEYLYRPFFLYTPTWCSVDICLISGTQQLYLFFFFLFFP